MSRKAMTLLELLGVIVILAVLASMTFGLMQFVESARVRRTESVVFGVGLEVAKHVSQKGYAPAKLEDLKLEPSWMKNEKAVDDWDRPLQYIVTGKEFKLWSCGPDGVSGTPDDIPYKRR